MKIRSRSLAALICQALVLGVLAGPAPVSTATAAVPVPVAPGVRHLGDSFVLRLKPDAARAARATPARLGAAGPLGLAGLDALAGELGGATFEPEFPGETPPPAGSGATDFTAFYIVHLPPGAESGRALDRFRPLPEVESATPISVTSMSGIPNDSLWSLAYHLDQPSGHDIHALDAWNLTTGDTSVVVAILDTGVIPYHPDLGGTTPGLTGNLWVNWAERGGRPGVDDDGNGYVDDVAGWDFVSLPNGDSVYVGEDWRDADSDPNDFSGHGTEVAGIVAGLTNNVIGIAGTGPTLRIMPLRVGWSAALNPTGEVSMTFAAQAIRYATRMGASVLNCSFSTDQQPDLDAAVDAAIKAGVTIVLAAGNNGVGNWLALRPDIIVVGATDRFDKVTAFSNRGPEIDLSAPGEEIPTTTTSRPGSDSLGLRQPRYLADANGTSFAAPQVAAAAALVQSRRHALGLPPLSPLDMLFRLRDTADDILALNPAGQYGTGRLDLYRALTDPPSSFAVRGGASAVGPAVVLPTTSGRARIVFPTSDSRLVFLDAASGDTLRMVNLPGTPIGWLAGADLGAGRGTGLFVTTSGGLVAGFDAAGDPLPGWPVSTTRGAPNDMVGGPALGDLDADGALEIVGGTVDGSVWAWRANGALVPGFPVRGVGVSQPVALSSIDAEPGVEIIVVSSITLHAIRYDGLEAAGWPSPVGIGPFTPPVVTATGLDRQPTVFVTAFNAVLGIGTNGLLRQSFTLSGAFNLEPAVGDLNGDGQDDLVLPLPGRHQTVVLDPKTGVGFPAPWPTAAFEPAIGSPILAHVSTHGAPDVIEDCAAGLVGIDARALPLPRFPPPLQAGPSPTAAQLRGDGAAQVIAGTGYAPGEFPGTRLLVVDAGPGTWDESLSPWPTLRGGFARTGSRLYRPPLSPLDDTPPPPVGDLVADSVGAYSATLRWTTPAMPRGPGPASAYEVRYAPFTLSSENFALGSPVEGVTAPAVAGEARRVRVRGLTPLTSYTLAVRIRDRVGSWSTISNLARISTGQVVPAAVAGLRAIAATDTSVILEWTATTAEEGLIRAARYEIRAAGAPLDESSFEQAPVALNAVAVAGPGGTERHTLGGLAPLRDYWVAVRAIDATGHGSALAVLGALRTGVGGPLRNRPGVAIASRLQPARPPLDLYWRGEGAGPAGRQFIRLYDLQGRQVRELPLGSASEGVAQWDGRDGDGHPVPAGIYFARLTSGSVHAQARVVLLP